MFQHAVKKQPDLGHFAKLTDNAGLTFLEPSCIRL